MIPECFGLEQITGIPNFPPWSAYSAGYAAGPSKLTTKLSLLFLYHRLFGINRAYAIWIKILGFAQLGNTIASISVNAFQCVPVHKY